MPNVLIRVAVPEDAEAIAALVAEHQIEGHLLPRAVDDIRARALRFVVGESRGRIVACAELAPLSSKVAEVRSLVVVRSLRRSGLGTRLVGQLRALAKAAKFSNLVAFTHDPQWFIRHNFSIVPHVWVPEKLATDCRACPLFRQCGQYAMMLPLLAVPGTMPVARVGRAVA